MDQTGKLGEKRQQRDGEEHLIAQKFLSSSRRA